MAPNVKIIAQSPSRLGFMTTKGTEVLIDGHKVQGVTKVELIAEVDGVWQARITMNASIEFETADGGGG